jgi:hypothetical protein
MAADVCYEFRYYDEVRILTAVTDNTWKGGYTSL